MTSVLRLGVYRERIEKYGASNNNNKHQLQTAQPQHQVQPGKQQGQTANVCNNLGGGHKPNEQLTLDNAVNTVGPSQPPSEQSNSASVKQTVLTEVDGSSRKGKDKYHVATRCRCFQYIADYCYLGVYLT